jgi:serine protease DegS
MNFRLWLKDFAWPAVAGLAIALLYLAYTEHHMVSMDSQTTMLPSGQAGPVSYADAAERAMPAVVNIYTKKIVRSSLLQHDPLLQRFLGRNLPQQQRVEGSLGSGVIVDTHGYVLTNFHVIADADEILVSLHDGRDSPAVIVGVDRETDLAVLKIDLADLQAIEFGDSQRARIGDVVLAIGNPFGVGQTVTQGIISAAARYGLELNIQENYLQTDAAINQGNSGGALVDAKGYLLGINTAIQSPSGGSVGIGYALPADTAQKVMRDIVAHGSVIRGWLGIESQAMPEYAARQLGLSSGQGVVVRLVYRDGPAAQAGLHGADIITHFDDAPAMATRAGMKRIAHAKPGEKIKVRYLRGRQVKTTLVEVGVKPRS